MIHQFKTIITSSLFFLAFSILFASSVPIIWANDINQIVPEDRIVVRFFEDRLCHVCRDQKVFMDSLGDKYPHMQIVVYDISDTAKLSQVAKFHGVDNYDIMAPTTFIGDNFFQFFEFGPRQQEQIIAALDGQLVESNETFITIPLINREINFSTWSLPILTILLGIFDGFNVCSLGALILILSIVIRLESRRKTFIYGGIFIVASTIIYGVLVFAWGQLFAMAVGQLEILRTIVGLAALGGGIIFFRDFVKFVRFGPACESGSSKLKSQATSRVIEALKNPKTGNIFLISSIIMFAAVITIIELPCSIGLPIAFTGILVEQQLSLTAYTFYILVYLLFYMLDELVVFTGAVLTKKLWFAGSKMITFISLAGSLVLFYLAYHYLIGF